QSGQQPSHSAQQQAPSQSNYPHHQNGHNYQQPAHNSQQQGYGPNGQNYQQNDQQYQQQAYNSQRQAQLQPQVSQQGGYQQQAPSGQQQGHQQNYQQPGQNYQQNGQNYQQNGHHQMMPNQNPPYPMGYEEEEGNGNMMFDYEEGDWYNMEPTGGQLQNNHGNQQPYHNGSQNGGNNGQNHNRNNNPASYRPSNQLCRRFGLRNDCSFDTFEFDFKLACKMHQIPARDRVDWLLMHLEGGIKEHARSWLKDRGEENQPTYEELIGELRPSFQQEMSQEIAERKLVGRKWNLFTSIDTFLHETRELVQCALPGLTQQWPNRIRSCLIQALPASWDQTLSCSDKSYQQMVEWIRAQS
ncbi:MAG: hypothetical protein GY820_47735, partial [Gammaproteobacteria bacterium]|nr:hypothetical protein [Gammaproteobacteria bacterium]